MNGSDNETSSSNASGQSGHDGHAGESAKATGAASGGSRTEEFKLSGEDIVAKVRQIVEEGNARRIIVRNADGHNLVEFPLTAGLIGAALLPMYAALGAVIALAANLTIVVEKQQ